MFNSYEGNAGFTGESLKNWGQWSQWTKRANNADIPWSRSSSSQRDRKKNKQILLLASTKARCS